MIDWNTEPGVVLVHSEAKGRIYLVQFASSSAKLKDPAYLVVHSDGREIWTHDQAHSFILLAR